MNRLRKVTRNSTDHSPVYAARTVLRPCSVGEESDGETKNGADGGGEKGCRKQNRHMSIFLKQHNNCACVSKDTYTTNEIHVQSATRDQKMTSGNTSSTTVALSLRMDHSPWNTL
jgi:hypothetical protein